MRFLRKSYTYLLPVFLILHGYASGVAGISIGSIIMFAYSLLAVVYFFANGMRWNSFSRNTLGLFLCFLTLSIIDFSLYGVLDPDLTVSSVFKMVYWFVGIVFTSRVFFDYKIFKPYFLVFCFVCTLYLFLQALSWNVFGFYLPNLFEFGPIKPLYETYSSAAYTGYLSSIGFGRFSSFFAEPAYYGFVMSIGLVVLLFDRMRTRLFLHKKILVFLLLVGIWLSTSTAAILFSLFILFVFAVSNRKINKLFFCVMLLFSIPLLLVFASTPLMSFFVEKVTTVGTSVRVGGSYGELGNLTTVQAFLGVGIGNRALATSHSYINEIAGLIMTYGAFGFGAFLIWYSKLFFARKSLALKVLLAVYFLAMSQGGYLFSLYGILVLTVAINIDKPAFLAETKRKRSVFVYPTEALASRKSL